MNGVQHRNFAMFLDETDKSAGVYFQELRHRALLSNAPAFGIAPNSISSNQPMQPLVANEDHRRHRGFPDRDLNEAGRAADAARDVAERMSIAWSPLADSPLITRIGSKLATPSFFPSRCSVASFVASLLRLSSAPFATADCDSMEI